jgi:ribosomal protein S27E
VIDFECHACGNPAVAFPKSLDDAAPVTCAACGAFLATYAEFKARAERTIRNTGGSAPVSGC